MIRNLLNETSVLTVVTQLQEAAKSVAEGRIVDNPAIQRLQ
jgi:hypothetical protein